jgi:glyoxylase I family protein
MSGSTTSEPGLALGGLVPHLEVFDMAESLRFYRDHLGFAVVHSSPNMGWCMLASGETSLMLNSAYDDDDERPPARDPQRQRWHRDVMLYIQADPYQVHARLREAGWPVGEPYVAPYGMLQVHTADPDGYGVAFITSAGQSDSPRPSP